VGAAGIGLKAALSRHVIHAHAVGAEETAGLNLLEKHCRRDAKAVTKLFHLLSVQLPLFLQNQGHNTLAAQVVRKVLLSESVGIH
jgi:hypothetical protein